jgi:hypothetical protein
MKLRYFKALWGMQGSYEEQIARIAEAGYDGVEATLPPPDKQQEFKQLLDRYELPFIAQINSRGQSVDEHIESFEGLLNRAVELKPVLINSQSARDSMEYEEQLEFFGRVLELEKRAGIQVGHETHRSRAMFTPWSTSRLLRDLPDLRITADFSHWVCVCERLLHDQEEHLKTAISRTVHIHGRVGYSQGPQVPDPSAPEYAAELARHIGWWQSMIRSAAERGLSSLAFTPEFGPPPYFHTLPHSNVPVADLWKICLWMRDYAKQQFEA